MNRLTQQLTHQLTPQELDQYAAVGYVLVKALFTADQLARWDRRFVALAEGREPLVGHERLMNDVMVVKGAVNPESATHAVNKLMSFEDDPELFDFVTDPNLLGRVKQLIGDDVYSGSTNVFNKPPGVDGRHPMHQDLRYYRTRPADGIVGVWTAVRPTDRETGCLAVIPASHRDGLLDHDGPDWEWVNHGFHGISSIDRGARLHVEMDPGDTLLFHPLLVHGSGRNRGSGFRRAISAHYISARCTSPAPDWRDNAYVRHLEAG